ncbi:Multidrug efflux pump subunit AcrB [Paenibacillus sp. UNCCL117]|uniref:efflux RND transporter permease subunit n=1 Tax=unclassified Paenibacillus TaxID=185978 RepID=UPI0008880B55|nr:MULTISPECIES: efflux RND transporter permease subunit [unclassified Paenibacillus]SDC76542.1 Multidrug efflux pump subunit AcrB [Paenibacillus sp. cl123]SFW25613.1 Multidrug efflux pump subunit AcrB [Paenibacillus sp. UNCCL117]
MNQLTNFSMKNITAVIIIVLLLFGGGAFASTTLKVESMPDISFPVVLINTQYTAPPKDVLDGVTKPLEKAVASLEGLKNLSSSSSDNFSQIVLELEQSVNTDDAKRDVESLISNVRLPSGSDKPKVTTFGFASEPVYYLSLYAQNGMGQQELDKLYKDVIEPGFNAMKGIDHIDSIGNQESVLTMKLNGNAINNYGLTPSQVSQSIRAALATSPAGTVDFNGNEQMVRVKSDLNTIYSLENMKVGTPSGTTVLLKDIAKVEAITESTFISRLNGQPAIGVRLYKTKNANAVEFGNEADKLMEGWKQQYPNITFQGIYNSAKDIKESINGMLKEGILGALLASIMILLFLRNVRMTIIVLVSIPLSMLITLMVMAPLGISLNIMTLGGMAIAIGRVVDDSIVVIENIYSQLQKAQERNESVIKMATAQVASAITSSTITTVGVFAPIAFVSGVMGEVFRPFAITLSVALLSSLLVAVTVIPMLAKLLVLRSKNIKAHDEAAVGKVSIGYKKALLWSLNHRILTVVISMVLLVVSVGGTVPFLAQSFMPESDSDKMMQFSIKMPRETTIETMNEKVKEIEAMMFESKDPAGQPTFDYVESSIGYNMGSDRVPYRTSFFAVASAASDAKAVAQDFKTRIGNLLPAGSEADGAVLSMAGTGGGTDFSYMLKGDDMLYLQEGAKQVKEKMKEFPELVDIKDSLSESKMEVEISVDQNKARLYGLSSAQIMEGVHIWLAEENIGDLKFDNATFETKVMVDPSFKNSVDKIGRFTIMTPSGTKVALNEVAKVNQIEAPAAITRDQQTQFLRVTAKIDSADKGGISAKVTQELNKIELPPGVRTEVKGVTDDIQESFQQMFVAMLASVFIVYLIMVLAFGNGSAPFAILFSLPLAAIGGLIALLVTNESLNITSLIGFLMLIGVVVTNAIVLIDRVQQLREEGLPVREALIEAGMTRLRPIIMTAGATIIALMPLALGFSKGALISKGLAVVVIGGLTTSTLLTLVVVPVAYDLIEGFKRRVGRLFRKKEKAAADANVTSATH